MATNEILLFANTNTGTNLLTQAEYAADSQRQIGHQPGIARAKLENKALRQVSLIAAGLAEFIADYQSNNVTDSLTPQNVADYLCAAIAASLAVTPPQFDNDTSLATTAFVQRAIGNFRSVVQYTNQTVNLTAADAGKVITCGGSSNTMNLPATAGMVQGVTYWFFTQGGPTVINAPSGGIIGNGSDNVSSITLQINEYVGLTVHNTNTYVVFAGSPMLKRTQALFNNSTSLATTEFVARALGNYRGATQLVNQSVSIDSTYAGKVVVCGGSTNTATLPDASAFPTGTCVHFFSQGGTTTINAATGDIIGIGGNTQTSFSLVNFDYCTLMAYDVNTWVMTNGTAMFRLTQPIFTDNTTVATTAFVQRALGNVRGSAQYNSGTNTLAAADVGKVIILGGGGSTIILPNTNDVSTGSMFHFFGQGGYSTINAVGGQVIGVGQDSTNSALALSGNEYATIMAVKGGNWVVTNGTSMLKNSGPFLANVTNAGYQKLPSGLIIQWGNFVSSSWGSAYASWPMTFPNACLSVMAGCGPRGSVVDTDFFAPGSYDRYGGNFWGSTDAGSAALMVFNYIAVGY